MASTLKLPGSKPEDEGFWEEYLEKVTDEDAQLIAHWQRILDTLLVYVGLFIAVLTAFIIQVSTTFQPGSGDATNNILISVYNHTMNASIPIDLQQYTTWNEIIGKTVSTSVFLLYISLAISISEASFALIVSIWLTRYQRSLTRTGSTIHERIWRRHRAYTGLMEWKLPFIIEILPIVALLALVLFALFIRLSVSEAYPAIGDVVDNIFIAVSILFVFSASFAAFIPDAPFHSPLSDFIRFIFQLFPNWSILGFVRIRTVCVTLLCISISLFGFLSRSHLPWVVVVLLQFLVPASLLSLCQGTRVENEARKHPKPRLFDLATWLYFHFIIVIFLSFSLSYLPSFALYVVFYSLRGVVFVISTLGAMKMLRRKPDEGKAKVEAVAWMIKTQPSHDLPTFRNAVEIARNSPHLRSTFLTEILPILDSRITSIRGEREQDLADDEKIYIILLAILVDFEPCKISFWRNEAAMKLPKLSDELKDKLRNLHKDCDGHSETPLSGCTKAEAEFILGKVGEAVAVRKESAWVESHVAVDMPFYRHPKY